MKTNDKITNIYPEFQTDANQSDRFVNDPQDYTNYTQCICKVIRSLRERYYVQSQELATFLGISNSNYSRLERGQVSGASEAIMEKILSFYRIDNTQLRRLVDYYFEMTTMLSPHSPRQAQYRPFIDYGIVSHPFSIYHYRYHSEKIYHNEPYFPILGSRFRHTVTRRSIVTHPRSLFIEIPLFSDCEVSNSRIFFKNFVGKTYITNKLFVNNLQHGFHVAGILKDEKISLVSKAPYLKRDLAAMLPDFDDTIVDQYGKCLLSNKPFVLKFSDGKTATEKYYNTYDYPALSNTSLEIFLAFFKDLINSNLADQKPLSERLHEAYNLFVQLDLEACMQNCDDLFEAISCDSCYNLFRLAYTDALQKFNF